jgi:hypothetical protein
VSGEPASRDARPVSGPVIVLTYAHAGVELLMPVLGASSSLACTFGSGLLPLCHSAAATWKVVEKQDLSLSALAIKSIRSLAGVMNAVILADAGASRWCEVAFAGMEQAETFMQLFPTATCLCLHRSLEGVLDEAVTAYPWGLGGSPLWSYSGTHPGNTAAIAAAYWIAHTEPLLAFEAKYPQSCRRLRAEDLSVDLFQQAKEIFDFLGLDARDLAVLREPHATLSPAEAGDVTRATAIPVGKIPAHLLAKASGLHADLGYAPWPPT